MKVKEEQIEEIRELAKTETSYRAISMKVFGTENARRARRIMELNGITILNYKGTVHSTDKIFPDKWTKFSDISGVSSCRISGSTIKKTLFREKLKEEKCECCGNTEWMGKKIPLEVHHKDGNRFNNNIENLEILCPNCHAQTENYRGKNIKGERRVCTDDEIIKIIPTVENKLQVIKMLNCSVGQHLYDRIESLINMYNLQFKAKQANLDISLIDDDIKIKRCQRIPKHDLQRTYETLLPLKESITKFSEKNTISDTAKAFNLPIDILKGFFKFIGYKVHQKKKISWPNNDDLQKMIETVPLIRLAKELGVSDNAIRKHCIRNKISMDNIWRTLPKRII